MCVAQFQIKGLPSLAVEVAKEVVDQGQEGITLLVEFPDRMELVPFSTYGWKVNRMSKEWIENRFKQDLPDLLESVYWEEIWGIKRVWLVDPV